MLVSVLVFSTVREALGRERLEVELQEGNSGADLLDYLSEQYAYVRDNRSYLRLARNLEYVPESCVLDEGDEIAVIAPICGG